MVPGLLQRGVYIPLLCVALVTAAHPASQTQDLLQNQRQQPTASKSNLEASYQPAIIGTATTSLFAYASEVGLQFIHEKFASLQLPNTHTSWNIPVVGTVNLDLSGITLQSLDIASTDTGVAPNSRGGVRFTATGLKTYVTCRFHYYKNSFPKISGSGQADVRFEDGAVQYNLIPLADGVGHPKIISQEPAQVSFGSIDVHTSHTPAAWLYNLFLSTFQGPFKGAITAEVSRYTYHIAALCASPAHWGTLSLSFSFPATLECMCERQLSPGQQCSCPMKDSRIVWECLRHMSCFLWCY